MMALSLAPFAERIPPAGKIVVPWPSAAIDLDFVAQVYYWGGAFKTTGDFTAFSLGAGSIGASGLTPGSDTDIRISLSGLGAFIPGSYGAAVYQNSAPAATATA